MTTALLISTYNNPDYLRMSLMSALAQSELPDEILVADDGSTQNTARVVRDLSLTARVPVKHIWHEDKGFRLAAIRNKAILAAAADYILQIDGDIILHPDFVADHKKFARKGTFVTGSRKLLSEDVSKSLMPLSYPEILSRLPGGCRIPFLTAVFQNLRASDGMYVRGCHMAFWREDLLRVNGYNEDITGWGREDSELSYRLMNAGVKKRFLKFGALEYHLYHPEASRDMDARNIGIMNLARSGEIVRVSNGIVKN